MPAIDDLSLSVIKLLYEKGATSSPSALSFLEVKDRLNLTKWSLADIEEYLLSHGYAERQGLGPTRMLWLTQTGIDLAAEEKAA